MKGWRSIIAAALFCVAVSSSVRAQQPYWERIPVNVYDVQLASVWDQETSSHDTNHPGSSTTLNGQTLQLSGAVNRLPGTTDLAINEPGTLDRDATARALWAQQPSSRRGSDSSTALIDRELALLKQRITELETSLAAHEDATRTIIRQSFAERGSQINDFVTLGGTLETLTFWAESFGEVGAADLAESDIVLDTFELDFEIQVNPWTLGSVILEYLDGTDFAFLTDEDDAEFVDRINVDTAFITIGDTQRCWLFGTFGRIVVPFGISTGDPVTDVLNIDSPLTVDVFETKEDVILIGFAGPTPAPRPPPTPPTVAPPKPRPLLVGPFFSRLSQRICPCIGRYPPPPAPPIPIPPPPPLPLNGAIYFYNGDVTNGIEDHIEHIGGTLGYRTQGYLSNGSLPWSLDMDVDFNSSVFNSRFLAFEYRRFLPVIANVPGMAAHVKTAIGPVGLVVEWNGAINNATFFDEAVDPLDPLGVVPGDAISIRPEAWQVSMVYQFDWNPTVEVIGAQGTYLTVSYSESEDLAGVTRVIGGVPTRVGFVPEKRFLVSVGEWIFDTLRVAVEYSHVVDYDVDEGGTGHSAHGWFMQMTYEW